MAAPVTCLDCGCPGGQIDLTCKRHKVCQQCFQKKRARLSSSEMFECGNETHDVDVEVSENPSIWIFVDDSNIWIAAKALASRTKHFKTGEDHRVRIDIGKLTDVVAAGRPVAEGILYGSEPPPVDSVWEKIRQQGWKVTPKKRSLITYKEKQLDTQIVADITEMACITPREMRTTIVVITGDADVIPAIEKVQKYDGWTVEVYMWKHALSASLGRLRGRDVQVHQLDDHLEEVTFTNMRFDEKNFRKHMPEVKASGMVLSMEQNAFRNRVPTSKWCNQLESVAQWPFQYYWIKDDHGQPTDDLLVIFKKDSVAGEFDTAEFLESVQPAAEGLGLRYVKKVQTFLTYSQAQLFEHYAFEAIGNYSSDDCRNGMESAPSLSTDKSAIEPWKLSRCRSNVFSRQLYSDRCIHGLRCTHGSKCHNRHTEEEKMFFKKNGGQGNRWLKVKQCSGRCGKSKRDCQYAHGEEDSWCLSCRVQGHSTENCPDS